jgi:hypothetical protein
MSGLIAPLGQVRGASRIRRAWVIEARAKPRVGYLGVGQARVGELGIGEAGVGQARVAARRARWLTRIAAAPVSRPLIKPWTH